MNQPYDTCPHCGVSPMPSHIIDSGDLMAMLDPHVPMRLKCEGCGGLSAMHTPGNGSDPFLEPIPPSHLPDKSEILRMTTPERILLCAIFRLLWVGVDYLALLVLPPDNFLRKGWPALDPERIAKRHHDIVMRYGEVTAQLDPLP